MVPSLKDTSHQKLAQLKNSSYVYMVYNGSSSCFPHCGMSVSTDDSNLKQKPRRLINILSDMSSKTIEDTMLVCAMPTYLVINRAKAKRNLNCTTVRDLSELVLPEDLVTFAKRTSDDNEYIDPFNSPEVDVHESADNYPDYSEEGGDYSNGDYHNDESDDYGNDYEYQTQSDDFPEYEGQQIEVADVQTSFDYGNNNRNQAQDTSSNDSQCPTGALRGCIEECPKSNLIAFKVCVNVCVGRCP